jgi:acetoin utilization deacetylase AcuC-like enzyme
MTYDSPVPLTIIHTDRFTDHQTPPGHPESPERGDVMSVTARERRAQGGEVVAPRMASHEQLARVHDEQYVQRIAGLAGRAFALDPDTYTSPDSYDVARLAAGAAIEAVERVLAAPDQRALALVRPPGHHAERSRAMGFCLFNNVAVAAAHARALGAARVAIVDYDVHHGNGTQHTFEEDPAVLYVSTHQYPFYPGTGAAGEIGRGAGRGFTVNLPLEVGALDGDYKLAFDEVIVPVLMQFKPDLVLISAGFDAHARDPLAGMRLTTEAFGAMTAELRNVAEECCRGRVVAITEGGYDLSALAQSIRAAMAALDSVRADLPGWPPPVDSPPTRGRASVAAARQALAPFWKL